jgi:hypothetical protein
MPTYPRKKKRLYFFGSLKIKAATHLALFPTP